MESAKTRRLKIVCELLTNINGFADLLVWPTSCSYYFYLMILEFIFLFLTWSTYDSEEDKVGKANIFPSLAISSIVVLFLASIGTLIVNTQGIPVIQADIMLILIAQLIVLVGLWIFNQ